MAYLAKARKTDLLQVCEELYIPASGDLIIKDIRELLTKSSDYDEEFVKALLDTIVQEREETEAREDKERELAELAKVRVFELEKN